MNFYMKLQSTNYTDRFPHVFAPTWIINSAKLRAPKCCVFLLPGPLHFPLVIVIDCSCKLLCANMRTVYVTAPIGTTHTQHTGNIQRVYRIADFNKSDLFYCNLWKTAACTIFQLKKTFRCNPILIFWQVNKVSQV